MREELQHQIEAAARPHAPAVQEVTEIAPTRPGTHLRVLDGIRALAALEVLFGHSIWFLWQTDSPLTSWTLAHKLVAFVVRYGGQAVLIFFVLSGFVIHYRYARASAEGRRDFSIGQYAVRRARRIYPPLLFALLLTLLLDRLGIFINPALYRGDLSEAFNSVNLPVVHAWQVFAGNLLFMQDLVPGIPPFGTDNPLGTLAYEGIFYALYPALFIPLHRRLGPHKAFALLLVICNGVAPLIPQANLARIPIWFGIWLAGAWLAELVVRGVRFHHAGLVLALTGVLLAVLALGYGPPSVLYDWLWVLAAGLLMLVTVYDPAPYDGGLVRFVRWFLTRSAELSGSSYTLYLIHFPILSFVLAVWRATHPQAPAQGWLAFGTAAGIVVLAMLFAQIVEKPFTSQRG